MGVRWQSCTILERNVSRQKPFVLIKHWKRFLNFIPFINCLDLQQTAKVCEAALEAEPEGGQRYGQDEVFVFLLTRTVFMTPVMKVLKRFRKSKEMLKIKTFVTQTFCST